MPITITRIEPQKRKNNRYSLFAGAEFIISVNDKTLLEFGIHTGQKLSEEIIVKIKKKESYYLLYEQALRYLARRAHAKYELGKKLTQKGFDKNSINKILGELEKKKYLNDSDFARIFTLDEIRLRKSGPLRIQQKLIQKGIHTEIIQECLRTLYPEDLQEQNAQYFAEKKLNIMQNALPAEKQKKLAAFLKGKGYAWQISTRVIKKFTGDITDEA
jgi:regulatory protein